MSDTQTPIWQRWNQFRFSVIGELLFIPPPKGQLQKTFSHLDAKIHQHPINPDRKISLGASTIKRCSVQEKYRCTEMGKRRHREAEKRRRIRQNKKTMDDASSTPVPGHAKVARNPEILAVCCRFCGKPGRIVRTFPNEAMADVNSNL